MTMENSNVSTLRLTCSEKSKKVYVIEGFIFSFQKLLKNDIKRINFADVFIDHVSNFLNIASMNLLNII